MNLVKHNLDIAFEMLRNPAKTLEEIRSEKTLHALIYLLMFGAVTAFLTPFRSIWVSRTSMVSMQVGKLSS